MRKKFIIPDFQATLPFTGGIRRRGALFAYERRVLFILGLILSVCAILYVFFIAASVSHIVAREELARENSRLAILVSRLESDYMAEGSLITEAYARSLGFVTPSSHIFLEVGGSLSLRDAR